MDSIYFIAGFYWPDKKNQRKKLGAVSTTDKNFIIRYNSASRIAIEPEYKVRTSATGDNNGMIPLC